VKYFALTLEALSPLAIRADHAAVGAGSSGYLPGTALSGGLAHAHRRFFENDTPGFENLFLSGQVLYPDLYPADFKSASYTGAYNLPVYPLPKTAQSCKRFPGFSPVDDEEVDDEPHGARDTLLDWAMFALGQQATLKESGKPLDTAKLFQPLEDWKACKQSEPTRCKRPMDHFTGYYRRADDATDHPFTRRPIIQAKMPTRLQTHTGINRETGTVEDGILYHRRVFEEHTHFWGLVKTFDDQADPFEQFITGVGRSGLVRVGTGRTRGMGKVALSVQKLDEAEAQARYPQFTERLTLFSNRLRERALETFPPDEYTLALAPFYFALTLHSPLILHDDLLRYRTTIDIEALLDLLARTRLERLPRDTFPPKPLLYQAASTRRVSGWNDLWGTPRTNEYAIDTGSVFLFACNVKPDEALLQALFRLEEEGAGRRRAEGFGRVCVSDPFHLEEQPR
jgi:CRISPR-associated protein Csx10